MNTELLKKKILQLAMQGKLVKQEESDGTADELIDKILEEKKQLMAEGKIKKEKLSRIYKDPTDNHYYEKFEDGKVKDITDLIPYEIPKNWIWERIGIYAEKVTDEVASGSFQAIHDNVKTYKEENYALMVKTADFSNNFSTNLTYTDEHGYNFLKNSNLYGGELILCNIGSIGKVFIVPDLKRKMTLAPNSIMIRLIFPQTRDYLFNLLQSPYGYNALMDKSSGSGMKKLNKKDFKSILIPIPPLKEQTRICKKLDELLPQIDYMNTCFINIERKKEYLKSKIIDMAIHGELTKQLSTDTPSSKLIENILDEKRKLIKEKKIKKENLSIIYKDPSDNQFYEKFDDGKINKISDDISFDLPDSWEFVKLGNILEIARGGSPRPIKDYLTQKANGLNWIKIGDTEKGSKYINKTNEKIKPEGIKKTRYVKKGDFILSNSMSFGRPYILNIDGCIHDGWLVLSNIDKTFNKDFLYYLLSSSYVFRQFIKKASGSAVDNLNSDKVRETIVPLPPIEEQKRIVLKIEKIFSLL